MFTVIVVIHLLLAVALVTVILLQKSEGGALGIGGGGMSGFMSGRSTANLLTRTTAVLTACFFGTSIALAMIASHGRAPSSVLSRPVTTQPAPMAPATPAKPQAPAAPAAPLTK